MKVFWGIFFCLLGVFIFGTTFEDISKGWNVGLDFLAGIFSLIGVLLIVQKINKRKEGNLLK